ncbi:putative Autophagy-specific protein [Planoprotostelium fungivorum]|uniref:Autophagy protein 5 n=1 Tax=Planoprotostelium fungivorum TaxID=1890364 RepID=A0A2P6MWH3_9EUKA|nr:putative Autophagy-specific protein [Planoprotostelium fungivorum]
MSGSIVRQSTDGLLDDGDIRKEMWKSVVPIRFVLHSNDISTLSVPDPLYLLIPRHTFLPLISKTIHKHFSSFTALLKGTESEMWFDHKGIPLKWNYPVGILYDIMNRNSGAQPWEVGVHFQAYPSDVILHCNNENTVKNYFVNALKESIYIKNGDCSRLNNLSVVDSGDLWEGFRDNDYSRFWQCNQKLSPEPSEFKYIPVRIFRDKQSYVQEIVTPYDEQGNSRTIGDVLDELFGGKVSYDRVKVQGLRPSMDTPIVWLSGNVCHPDNFLYVHVV